MADDHSLAGLCAGVDPVLEAVAELPANGLPIPSSAQAQIGQSFEKQTDTVTAATGRASPTPSRNSHVCDLQVVPGSSKDHSSSRDQISRGDSSSSSSCRRQSSLEVTDAADQSINVFPSSSDRQTGSSSASSGSPVPGTSPDEQEELQEVLREQFCSASCFDSGWSEPVPPEFLQLFVNLNLHTSTTKDGWSALHFACAMHNVELVKQLLEAGASVNAPEGLCGLQPLHLACMSPVNSTSQYADLWRSAVSLNGVASYVDRYGPGSADLVDLLLQEGADPNALAGVGQNEYTALHIVACWAAGCITAHDSVFNNPFMGLAAVAFSEAFLEDQEALDSSACEFCPFESYARSLLDMAVSAQTQLTSSLDAAAGFYTYVSSCNVHGPEACPGDENLRSFVYQLTVVGYLLEYDADINAQTQPHLDTPLMLAASRRNAALVDAFCRMGADTELASAGGTRALEVAAANGFPRVGWALLCHGAQAVPQWLSRGEQCPQPEATSFSHLPAARVAWGPVMMVIGALNCGDRPWNLRFLERLLADGLPIEDAWPDTGETPLLMAIRQRDVEMVRLLVQAGANMNARLSKGSKWPAVMHALDHSQQQEADDDILQILIDAGADIAIHTECFFDLKQNLVQYAAYKQNLTVTLKLVEAGVSWQMPPNQRRIELSGKIEGWLLLYAPEALCTPLTEEDAVRMRTVTAYPKATQLSMMESRFRRAEKKGSDRRAAAAAALAPWLCPGVLPAVKEATIRTLVAAGVTPSRPSRKQQRLQPAPLPAMPASWSGCLQPQQQMLQGVENCVDAWPRLSITAAAGAGRTDVAKSSDVRQQQDQQPAHTADDDIDALLAALGDDAATAAAPASSKAAASKKKKKETAAQKEAKKQEKLRLQRLQEPQQRQESEDGSRTDQEAEARVEQGDVERPAAVVAERAVISSPGPEGLDAAQETHAVAEAAAGSMAAIPTAMLQQCFQRR